MCIYAYLVADGHVGLANIVPVSKVYPLAPVHRCQAMEAFHSVGAHTPMRGDVVLGRARHVLKDLQEALHLSFAREAVPYMVRLTISLLQKYTIIISTTYILIRLHVSMFGFYPDDNLVMVTPGIAVVVQAVMGMEVEEAFREGFVGIPTAFDPI